MRPLAVVVAYREPMVAEALAAALGAYPWIAPVGIGTSGREVEECGARADAVAIDRQLPGAKATAARLRRKGVRVVFIGDNGSGASGIEKGDSHPEANGDGEGVSVSPRDSISTLAWALASKPPAAQPAPLPLTKRQREILELVAKGFAGKQVARHLGISPKTVERHKTRMFARLGVTNQTAAVSMAMNHGVARSQAWNPSNI
jgi:DNA-binding CsgD family transcriptional regulator